MATFVHREKLEADNTEIYQLQLKAPLEMTNLQLKMICITIKCPSFHSNYNFNISGLQCFTKDIIAGQGTGEL